jgi:hypothetical protein
VCVDAGNGLHCHCQHCRSCLLVLCGVWTLRCHAGQRRGAGGVAITGHEGSKGRKFGERTGPGAALAPYFRSDDSRFETNCPQVAADGKSPRAWPVAGKHTKPKPNARTTSRAAPHGARTTSGGSLHVPVLPCSTATRRAKTAAILFVGVRGPSGHGKLAKPPHHRALEKSLGVKDQSCPMLRLSHKAMW